MKKPYLLELQNRLLGTVTNNAALCQSLSRDSSEISVVPEGVVYPANTADVRKIVGFARDQTETGKPLSVIPRGLGGGRSGGAVGNGLQVVMTAAMNRVLRLDNRTVTVQPGLSWSALQQTLQTHSRWVAAAPNWPHENTIGGAVAANASGMRAVKYGDTRSAVTGLKVVLSDGSLIKTSRLSRKQLSKVMGQDDFEGQIYRGLDALLQNHHALIRSRTPSVKVDSSGYALAKVRGYDGSIDIGQLLVGSEGTLGIITEITLQTSAWNPRTSLLVGYLPDIATAMKLLPKIIELKPAVVEFVDGVLLEAALQRQPGAFHDVLPEKVPSLVLLVQFDDMSQLAQTMKARRAARILGASGNTVRLATDPVEQEALWKITAAAEIVDLQCPFVPPSLLEDGAVPVARWGELIIALRQLLAEHGVTAGMWGSPASGIVRVRPLLDSTRKKDAALLADIAAGYAKIIKHMGGSISASEGDGKIRASHLPDVYGPEMINLFVSVKQLFDPLQILNPGTIVTSATNLPVAVPALATLAVHPYHPFR